MGISVPLPETEDSWVDLTEGEYTKMYCGISSTETKPHLQIIRLVCGRTCSNLVPTLSSSPLFKILFLMESCCVWSQSKINFLDVWNFDSATQSSYFTTHLTALPNFKAWQSIQV